MLSPLTRVHSAQASDGSRGKGKVCKLFKRHINHQVQQILIPLQYLSPRSESTLGTLCNWSAPHTGVRVRRALNEKRGEKRFTTTVYSCFLSCTAERRQPVSPLQSVLCILSYAHPADIINMIHKYDMGCVIAVAISPHTPPRRSLR